MRRRQTSPERALDFFRSQLSTTDLHVLTGLGAEFRCPPQWPLVLEGTPAHDLYLIGEGTADVYRSKRKVARIGPGNVVGELAMWPRRLRAATVSAVTGLHGVRVSFDRVPELLDRTDGLESMVLATPVERTGWPLPSASLTRPR